MARREEALYSAEPLHAVPHRGKPTSSAERVRRARARARRRLRKGFLAAGRGARAGAEVEALRGRVASGAAADRATETRRLFGDLASEVIEAVDVGGGGGPGATSYAPPTPPQLTREERIKMHAVRAAAERKRKAGGMETAFIAHAPDGMSSEMVTKLVQMNETLRRTRPKDFMPVNVKVAASREMNMAVADSVRALSEKLVGPPLPPPQQHHHHQQQQQQRRRKRRHKQGRRRKHKRRGETPPGAPPLQAPENPHRSGPVVPVEEGPADHIQTDFWDNRLVSTLARPLGVEALLRSRPIPPHPSVHDVAPVLTYVSDAPQLDATAFRVVDQQSKVDGAQALGVPLLNGYDRAPDDLTDIDPPLHGDAYYNDLDDEGRAIHNTLRMQTPSAPSALMAVGGAAAVAVVNASQANSGSLRGSTGTSATQTRSRDPPFMFAYTQEAHGAAATMQRFARWRRARKEWAAVKIECTFRMYVIFRIVLRARRRLHAAATCIQCIHRGNVGRRYFRFAPYVVPVQTFVCRPWLARRRLHELRTRRAALHEYMGHVHLEVAKRLFVLVRSAKVIQRAWRALQGWRHQRQVAATKIQRFVRAWLAWLRERRRKAATLFQLWPSVFSFRRYSEKKVQWFFYTLV